MDKYYYLNMFVLFFTIFLMKPYKNKDLVKGIIEQDQNVLNYLYSILFKRVKKVIIKNGGNSDAANDVFQEAIIIIYRKVKLGTLNDHVMVESYIMGICKIIWFNQHKNESKKKNELKQIPIAGEDGNDEILRDYRQSLRMKLFKEHLDKLNSDCQIVLKLFFDGYSFAEIAQKLGFKSVEYARRKKYLCKEFLVKNIKNDPQFSKLIGEYDEELF